MTRQVISKVVRNVMFEFSLMIAELVLGQSRVGSPRPDKTFRRNKILK